MAEAGGGMTAASTFTGPCSACRSIRSGPRSRDGNANIADKTMLIPRTAPVSLHMILNFIAEKVLESPKSY